jgi:hypothetical protein
MVVYRLYCLSGLGKSGHVEDLEADSDEQALNIARSMKLEMSCEVWKGDRLVGHITYQSADPPFA